MLNRFTLFVASLFTVAVAFASIGEKTTVLTSGDKVHTIHYQLGQSTVLYFGMKPETVICGNENYFHIDKIKEGLTIQPRANISTNLTILNQGKRFLFYLTPANGVSPDTFIDVRWVPAEEAKPVAVGSTKQTVKALSGGLSMGSVDLKLLREIIIDDGKRSILEFRLSNSGTDYLKTSRLDLFAIKAQGTIKRQITVFENENLAPNSKTMGRLIVTGETLKGASLVVKYQGQNFKIQGAGY